MKTNPEPTLSKGKLILPIAPKAVALLRFGAPAQNSSALTPEAALAALEALPGRGTGLAVVELAGPGDPLATPDLTLATLDRLRLSNPELPRTLTTLGLGGAELAEPLRAHGLIAITLQVEAIDPEVLCRLYAWIRPGSLTIPIVESAQILASEQARTVKACKAAGIAVNIRTTLFPGYNEKRIAAVAARMAELGADSLTVVAYQPGNDGENGLEAPTPTMLREAQELAATWLLPNDDLPELRSESAPRSGSASATPRPSRQRPNLAVVSTNGREVDLHLGKAEYVLVYGPTEDGLVGLFGTRPAPKPGNKGRWHTLAETLNDCFAILTVSAGDNPRRILGAQGLTVLTSEGEVEGMVDLLFGGGRKRKREPRNIQQQNRRM